MQMKRFGLCATLSAAALLLLAGCAGSGSTAAPTLTVESSYPLQYAKQFTVDECTGGYELITIADSQYLVVPQGAAVPEDLPQGTTVLQQPIENIYLVSTSAMDPIISLGALDSIALSGTKANGWYLPEAKAAMQHNWNNMVLHRTYVAVVEGKVEEEQGVVKSYLGETSQYEVYSSQDPSAGQLAVTRYRRLATANGYSLMELELDTGRKNQIRVHMKDLGHSIVGDRKYGAKSSPIHRLALHARTLDFVHPMTRQELKFETPIPARFTALLTVGGK